MSTLARLLRRLSPLLHLRSVALKVPALWKSTPVPILPCWSPDSPSPTPSTPQPLNPSCTTPLSNFVKERFGAVKKTMPHASHGAIMKQLSQLWNTAKGAEEAGGGGAAAPAAAAADGSDDDCIEILDDEVEDQGDQEDLCCGVGRLSFV